MTDELIDRFGDPPRMVNNLIAVALLRSKAAACGVADISQKGMNILFTLAEFDLRAVSELAAAFGGRLLFSPGDKAVLTLKLRKGEDPLRQSEQLIRKYEAVLKDPANNS
jgi:transcription-repair coupling factor (superfamily II helicase)